MLPATKYARSADVNVAYQITGSGPIDAEQARMIDDLRENWPSIAYLTGAGGGLGHDVDRSVLDFALRYAQASASPSAIVALEQMNAQIDTRDILPTIRVPTLVMNRTGDPVAHVDAARDLAARIPGSRFVEFPGKTHMISEVDYDRICAEIEEFITGSHTSAATDRFLATMLFVDIVGSTQRAATLGDASWREFLERFYALIERELRVFRGIEVDRAGDGVLARFDGPARAIRCAVAIEDSVKRLGVETRLGVHTGECELVGSKLGGIAVHVGARIVAHARPGEVLVSSTVKDLVAGSGIEFDDRGTHGLRGIPTRWHLFAVQKA